MLKVVGKHKDVLEKVSNYIIKSRNLIFDRTMCKVYKKEDTPQKKYNNALKSIAPGVFSESVLLCVDTTLRGKGGNGYIVTSYGICYREFFSECDRIQYKDIESIYEDESGDLVVECMDTKHTFSKNEVEKEPFKKFLEDLNELYKTFTAEELRKLNDSVLPLEVMEEKTKIFYLKAIIDYEKIATKDVLGAPLAEIMSLMTQLHFTADMRAEVKSYLLNSTPNMLESVNMVVHYTPAGNETNIKISLLKDMIRTTRSRGESHVVHNPDLLALEPLLQLDNFDSTLELLEQSMINDEKLIKGEITEKQYKKRLKDVVANGAAIGVPVAAIYMAGSVVGLSAAGITSGLAALGFGGLFGLSAMMTGIGVLIVGGVMIHSAVKYVTSGKERARNSKREVMIQEIVAMHQETINGLVEDIESYTERINALYQDKENREADINALQEEMRMFKEALVRMKNKEESLSA